MGLGGRSGIERGDIFKDNKDRENLFTKDTEEKFERRYEMKRLGYDLDQVEGRVCETYKVERGDVYLKGRQKVRADARALFCFWAVRELGYSQSELARRLGMSQSGVGSAVNRGELIARSSNLQLAT